MARCKHCKKSGLLLRTDARGLCANCGPAIQKRVDSERARIKEAMIRVRFLKDDQDREMHLHRARESARELVRYEQLGYGGQKPDARALTTMLERELRQLHAESPGKETGKAPTRSTRDAAVTPSSIGLASQPSQGFAAEAPAAMNPWPVSSAEERRTSGRSPAALWVRLEDGLRARTEDISPFGMRLRTSRMQPPGTRLRLSVDSPKGSVNAEGVVRWALSSSAQSTRTAQAILGLQFPTPLAELEMYG